MRVFLLLIAAALALPARATEYVLDENAPQVLGEVTTYTTVYEDTFTDIARRYSLGWEELIRVNPGIDPWVPGAGKQLVIPTQRILPSGPHEGIVINLPEHRLYYFPKPKKGEKPRVITYAVSIAKMDWHTPLGETRIVSKEKNPNWYPPESVRKEHAARGEPLPAVVKPGPDNPLGAYKMRLGITPGAYLIHGTNNPLAVGMAVTHGCMRMYPEDIEALYPLVPVGTKVRIVNEPVKVAFVNGELLLEVHPPVDSEGQTIEPDLELFSKLLDQALGPTVAAVHWDLAREVMQKANGLPTVVGLEADLDTPQTQTADAGEPAPGAPTDAAGNGAASPSEPGGSALAPAASTATATVAEAAPSDSASAAPTPTQPSAAAASATAAQSAPALAAAPPAPAVTSSAATERTVTPLPATPPQVTPPQSAHVALPALPPEDSSRAPSESSARTFPAGDPAASTAHAVASPSTPSSAEPSQSGSAVAPGPDHPEK
ncbi:MAG TPA: L,D-transpeptidase family protein [Steroidobacteraceae bacterium]|nr:L,D-transpeptidase family protein [Steroidobacteraceae bacterium]